MRDALHEEKYKGGLTIKIYQDEDARSPDEDGDDGLFLVGYHRDFFVDRKKTRYNKETGRHETIDPGINQGFAQVIANNARYEDGSICEEAREYIKKYHIFGFEAYIHSGVRLALSYEGNFCDRQWDVSQLGLVFVSKKEWRLKKSARKAALGLIESWNDYLDGNVYGYVVEGPDGEHLDSCWGFSGDYDKWALPEGRSMAEYHYKEILKKKAEKTKAYIKNHVPLEKREAVTV